MAESRLSLKNTQHLAIRYSTTALEASHVGRCVMNLSFTGILLENLLHGFRTVIGYIIRALTDIGDDERVEYFRKLICAHFDSPTNNGRVRSRIVAGSGTGSSTVFQNSSSIPFVNGPDMNPSSTISVTQYPFPPAPKHTPFG